METAEGDVKARGCKTRMIPELLPAWEVIRQEKSKREASPKKKPGLVKEMTGPGDCLGKASQARR